MIIYVNPVYNINRFDSQCVVILLGGLSD